MAIVVTDSKHYADIAAAIRSKNSEQAKYKPEQMAAATKRKQPLSSARLPVTAIQILLKSEPMPSIATKD